MNLPPDCLRCGACCFSPSSEFVRVTGADWNRLGAEAGRVAEFRGNRAFMRMRDSHCAALEIRPVAKRGWEFFCTVYSQRPQICRDLVRGSAQCAGELATKGALRRE